MAFDSKMKLAAFKVAMDVTLKGMSKNPERCARNLIEMLSASFPNALTEEMKGKLYLAILELNKKADYKKIRDMLLEAAQTENSKSN